MNFRNVVADDLERLIQLENEGFTKEEAATTKALKQRIEIIPVSVLQMIYLHRLDPTPI